MSDLKKFFRREGEQQICNNRHSLTPVLILRDTVFGFDFFMLLSVILTPRHYNSRL